MKITSWFVLKTAPDHSCVMHVWYERSTCHFHQTVHDPTRVMHVLLKVWFSSL